MTEISPNTVNAFSVNLYKREKILWTELLLKIYIFQNKSTVYKILLLYFTLKLERYNSNDRFLYKH